MVARFSSDTDWVSVQETVFNLHELVDRLRSGRTDVGAVVSFLGTVRELTNDPLEWMELEHYPGMTESVLKDMVGQARQRFDLLAVSVVHRVGRLFPADPIVGVVVASAHRAAAFEACQFLMDLLKTQAPFWKREALRSHGAQWVPAKESDDACLARWGWDGPMNSAMGSDSA